MSRGRWRSIYSPSRNLPVDRKAGTGYFRTKWRIFPYQHRIFPVHAPEVPVRADISATISGAPLDTICELLGSTLSEKLVHRIFSGKFRSGRIFPPQCPVATQQTSASFLNMSLAVFMLTGYIRGLTYFRSGADIFGTLFGVALGTFWEQLLYVLRENLTHRIFPDHRPDIPV